MKGFKFLNTHTYLNYLSHIVSILNNYDKGNFTLCIMPRSWQYATPLNNICMYDLMCASDKGVLRRRNTSCRSVSMHSNAIAIDDPCAKTSNNLTICIINIFVYEESNLTQS